MPLAGFEPALPATKRKIVCLRPRNHRDRHIIIYCNIIIFMYIYNYSIRLVLRIAGHYKVRFWTIRKWHTVHNKFHENKVLQFLTFTCMMDITVDDLH
jgi:hypothetical protein